MPGMPFWEIWIFSWRNHHEILNRGIMWPDILLKITVFLWTLHLKSKNKEIYQSVLKLVRTKKKKVFFSFHILLPPFNFLLLKSVPKKIVQTMKSHSCLPASNRLPQGGRSQAQADIFSFWLLLPRYHRTTTEKLPLVHLGFWALWLLSTVLHDWDLTSFGDITYWPPLMTALYPSTPHPH